MIERRSMLASILALPAALLAGRQTAIAGEIIELEASYDPLSFDPLSFTTGDVAEGGHLTFEQAPPPPDNAIMMGYQIYGKEWVGRFQALLHPEPIDSWLSHNFFDGGEVWFVELYFHQPFEPLDP